MKSTGQGLRHRMGIMLMALGGIFALIATLLFATQLDINLTATPSAWGFYFCAVAAWIIGVLLWTQHSCSGAPKPVSWWLLPIILLAALLRFSELDTLPYGIWYDEALNAVDTREIILEPSNRPVSEHNTTFLHYLLYAASMSATGLYSITGVRLVQALFGVGAVIMAYFVGRRLGGERFGLLFAFTLAVMRWSINFSRIGMTGVEVGFFLLLGFYALHRLTHNMSTRGLSPLFGKEAERRGTILRHALLVGVAVGLGLWFYRAFQLLLLPLLLYAALAWRWREGGRRVFAVIGMAGATLLLVILPLGITALFQPDLLFGRIDQTSIFAQDLQGRPVLDVIGESSLRHMQMFHWHGDRNGRHNLPGAPMLDPATGALFAAGLIVALYYVLRRQGGREHLFFALTIPFSLAAGILSIPSESPQALRTIGVLPAIAYFTALAWDALLRLMTWLLRDRVPLRVNVGVGVVLVTALALPMLALNYVMYFQQQRTTYANFVSYSTRETLAARILNDLPLDGIVWTSANMNLGIQAELLAPQRRALVETVELAVVLPIEQFAAPLTILISGGESVSISEVQRLYPDVDIQTLRASDYGVGVEDGYEDTMLYAVTLSPADIAAAENNANEQGLMARYYDNDSWAGDPVLMRTERFIHRYIHVVPLSRPYTVEWTARLYAPSSGNYRFSLRAAAMGSLTIDGERLIEADARGASAELTLTVGWHDIEVRHLDTVDYSSIYLEWLPPDATRFMPISSEYVRPSP